MHPKGVTEQKGIIAWFASNHVAANLLMFLIIAFGIGSSFTIRKQTTPDFQINQISVRVPYLGAAPQEVTQFLAVLMRGIRRILEAEARAPQQRQQNLLGN